MEQKVGDKYKDKLRVKLPILGARTTRASQILQSEDEDSVEEFINVTPGAKTNREGVFNELKRITMPEINLNKRPMQYFYEKKVMDEFNLKEKEIPRHQRWSVISNGLKNQVE